MEGILESRVYWKRVGPRYNTATTQKDLVFSKLEQDIGTGPYPKLFSGPSS